MPTNKALYLPFKKAPNFEVKSAPYPFAPPNGIVVKNHAIAINPADWILQEKGDFIFTWLKYPCIFGSDVAGEVVEVGKQITNFQVGDRVLGYAIGLDEKVNDAAEGAFQEYTVLRPNLTTHIPDSLSYEKACVLPLGVATAVAALFQKDQLGLELPTMNSDFKGKTIIVWGGSSSVGSNAIQLGVAAGYEVFATASLSNFEYVMKLGASKVFDYKSKTVVADMIAEMKGKTAAGAISLERSKVISMANFPALEKEPEAFVLLRTIYFLATWMISFKIKGLIKGIKSNFLFATTVAYNEVGIAVYVDFLPRALEMGTYVAAPEPHVSGQGIESLEKAIRLQKKGVSARKVVVTF